MISNFGESIRPHLKDIFNAAKDKHEEYTNAVFKKMYNGLVEFKGVAGEQQELNKSEQAKRFAAVENIKTEGVAGAAQKLSAMRGQFEKINPGEGLGLHTDEENMLMNVIHRSTNLSTPEQLRAHSALFTLLNGDRNLQPNEIKLLDKVYKKYLKNVSGPGASGGYDIGNDVEAKKALSSWIADNPNASKDEVKEFTDSLKPSASIKDAISNKTDNRSIFSKGAQAVGKVSNTMKSMLNSFNVAAPILHGLPLTSHPKEFVQASMDMIKYMGNKEAYNTAMEAIDARPNSNAWRDAGLFIAEPESIKSSEEDFANSYVGSIPGVRSMVSMSKRGYTGFLNELRSKVADKLAKNFEDSGVKVFEDGEGTKIAKNIAKYVNNSTDRGSLGKLEKMAPELNYLLWSPRRLTARLTMLNPKYYYDLDRATRWEALKSLFATASAGMTMVGTGVAAGGTTSMNPNNPDFMKVRFGDHVLNPLGPTESVIVAAAKMIKEVQRMGSGQKAKFGQPNVAEIGGNLIRNRESPLMRLADELATAKQLTGDKKEGDMSTLSPPEYGGLVNRFGKKKYISSEISSSFTPIFIQDVQDLLKTDKNFAESVGLAGASFIGISELDSPKPRVGNFRRLQP